MRRLRRIGLWCGGLLAAAIVLSVALVAPLRWLSPPTTAFMERARSERGALGIHYRWTPLERIAPSLAICVMTAEDQLFPEHAGFDVSSIRKALAEERRRTRGASTITQQVAKNLYLWPGRSLLRKALEAWFTVWLETLLPKRRILELYLNVAEFAPGVYGAGAASQRLFGKPAARLTLEDATLLAAVLPNPHRMHAARPSEYVKGRAEEIQTAVGRWGHRLRGVL